MKKFVFTTVSLVALVLIFGHPHRASALTLSPARRIVTIDPGTAQDLKVTVTNDEAKSVRLQLLVTGLKQDPAGLPLFGNGYDDAEKWVVPAPELLVLEPGQQGFATFKLQVPAGTFPGSHWVALAVESRPDTTGTAILNQRLISLLSIQVSGVVTESLTMNTAVSERIVLGSKPFDAAIKIQNTGSIEVPLTGKITIRSLRGKEVGGRDVQLGNQLLPQSERSLLEKISTTKKDACDVDGTVCSELVWPGLYTLTAEVIYGKTGQTVESETSFWYVPYWSLFLLTVGVGLGVWIVRRIRQRSMIKKYVA